MKSNKKHALILVLPVAAALLTGCQFVPNYFKPSAPIPEAFPIATENGARLAADIGWREFFKDP